MITTGAGLGLQFVGSGIGLALGALGELEAARAVLIEAVEDHADGFVWAQIMTLIDLAHVERLLNDPIAAHASAGRALDLAGKLGHGGLASRARHQLAWVAVVREDWRTAEHFAHDAFGHQVEHGDAVDVPESLDLLAEIAIGLESHREAARLLGAAARARADLGLARWGPDETRVVELMRQLHDALGADELADATAEGVAMPIDAAAAYTRRARGARKRPSSGWESLTPTELAVVRHAAAGLTNPEIAERMFIARGTVKVHLSHIYAKLGLRNRAEVAAEAIRRESGESG
jgi:DNA-binding CsgD family transcriptional regulator